MGSCANCKFCNEKENETIYSSIKIATNSFLGECSQETPGNEIFCFKATSFKNGNLLDNMKFSVKEKRMFEKKLTKIKMKSKASNNNQYAEKLDLNAINLPISKRLFITEIKQPLEKKYKIIKNLGNGSYGDVFLAYNIYTQEKVAIKKIYKSNEVYVSPGKIIDEIEILKALNHPNIVKLIEFYGTEDAYYIVDEYCPWGELYDKAVGYLSETQISIIFKQILSGIAYLHSKNIVHRDLKLENILISDKEYVEGTGEEYYDIKIIDFGNARIFNKAITNNSIVGSSYYIAPEVFQKKYNRECDLWSAGVILYMLIVGSPPFTGDSDKKIKSNIKTGIYNTDNKRWLNASFEVRNLISKLLVYDPNKRLSAIEALQHPWFQKANSDILFYNIPKVEILHLIQNLLTYDVKSKFEELVLCYIVHSIPMVKETKIAIKLFKLINIKGDGKIKKDELKNALLYFVTEEYLQNLDNNFKLLDGENHGYIEIDEFLRAVLDKNMILSEENLKYAFNYFSKYNNEFILEEHMSSFFDVQLCNNIFKEIDINKEGKIDFQQFKNMMKYD